MRDALGIPELADEGRILQCLKAPVCDGWRGIHKVPYRGTAEGYTSLTGFCRSRTAG